MVVSTMGTTYKVQQALWRKALLRADCRQWVWCSVTELYQALKQDPLDRGNKPSTIPMQKTLHGSRLRSTGAHKVSCLLFWISADNIVILFFWLDWKLHLWNWTVWISKDCLFDYIILTIFPQNSILKHIQFFLRRSKQFVSMGRLFFL